MCNIVSQSLLSASVGTDTLVASAPAAVVHQHDLDRAGAASLAAE